MTIPWNPDSGWNTIPYTAPLNFSTNAVQSGWQCPVCFHVMAPFTSYCLFCPPTTVATANINCGAAADEVVKDLKDKIEREFAKPKRNAA